ncbi:MAG: proline dehydrogenase family protein [Acidobacteriota bacterium]
MSLFNKLIVGTLPLIPKFIVGSISKRYIAGERMIDAVRMVRKLNQERFMATIDLLGEHASRREEAIEAADEYVRLIEAIAIEKLDSNVSIKLTHLGLKLDYEFCLANVSRIVAAAKERGNFVRLDMEDSSCTDDTMRMYMTLRRKYWNVGLVFQAYLRRTIRDIRSLIDDGMNINVRLCKGIYNEARTIAYNDKEIINRNFALLLRELFQRGGYVAIATHDEKLVWEAFMLIDEFKLKPEQYEFQMLLGVDAELRRIIRDSGHRLRVYVPYGSQWYAYSARRLKENPQIARYVLNNLLKGS